MTDNILNDKYKYILRGRGVFDIEMVKEIEFTSLLIAENAEKI